jgi:hypothetical protein
VCCKRPRGDLRRAVSVLIGGMVRSTLECETTGYLVKGVRGCLDWRFENAITIGINCSHWVENLME